MADLLFLCRGASSHFPELPPFAELFYASSPEDALDAFSAWMVEQGAGTPEGAVARLLRVPSPALWAGKRSNPLKHRGHQ